jgi:tRNA pseudouridine synthase 10
VDLEKLEELVNSSACGKVEVSGLGVANRDTVRKLKKAESTQKEYRMIMGMKNRITLRDCRLLEEKLKNAVVRQRTPLRVLHRRADLTREKYIYDVKVKKLALKKAEMMIRCQGGLYIKELVTGDEGRTEPNVSGILGNEAKPIRLDVLKVIVED